MDLLYKNLLLRKHSNTIEIELHLFENCNLSCAFCSQDHNAAGPNLQSLQQKLKLVKQFIDSKSKYPKFQVNLMGGEILQDSISDDWINYYIKFINEINSYLVDKEVSFSITTNLIFNNTDRIINLIKELQQNVTFNINVSYDPAARGWSKLQLEEVYKPNIELFEQYIDSISITLHRITIEKLLRKSDSYLNYLYSKFHLNFDWYVPDQKLMYHFIPTDDNCKDILRYLKIYYPESSPVQEYLTQENNIIQCCSEYRILISADNKFSNCQYLSYKQSDFNTKINPHSTTDLFKNFIKQQNCISCPYFNRCGLYCYVAADFKGRKVNENCFLKEFFNELKE